MGRSPGGLTTKLHVACERGRKVLALVVTGGQRGDSPQLPTVLQRIRVRYEATAIISMIDVWLRRIERQL